MKQFTITIPDENEKSFIEQIKNISYITHFEETTVYNIPEEHKQIVRDRIKKYENSPESYLSWEDIENKMKLD